MGNKLIIILALLISASIISCKKNKDECLTPGQTNIQGTWKHDFIEKPNIGTPPEYVRLQFVNDSFFRTVRVRTDMLVEENCYESSWLEYSKGSFKIDDGRIYFEGIYTKEDFSVKTDGCFSTGTFTGSFGMTFCNKILTLHPHPVPSIPEEYRKINLVKQPN